jgi:hypothetical protein
LPIKLLSIPLALDARQATPIIRPIPVEWLSPRRQSTDHGISAAALEDVPEALLLERVLQLDARVVLPEREHHLGVGDPAVPVDGPLAAQLSYRENL